MIFLRSFVTEKRDAKFVPNFYAIKKNIYIKYNVSSVECFFFIATNTSCSFPLSYQLPLGKIKQHLPANVSLIRFRNSRIIFKINGFCSPSLSNAIRRLKKKEKKEKPTN